MASGLGLSALGAGVLATMPVPFWLKGLTLTFWIGYAAASSLTLARRYRDISGYRIFADGSAEIIRRDGRRVVAQLASGTVILPRIAWLRLKGPVGGPLSELVAGDPRTSQQWRRFQVICRHVAAC